MYCTIRNIVAVAGIACVSLFSACRSSQLGTGTDDVYVNPTEEKRAREAALAEQARKDAADKAAREEADAKAKAALDNDPKYKDPNYSRDDYYDYAYAARINRFSRPLSGAGYYDPYYTNMYTYNANPAMYGTSIYSSYNWGMPSTMFQGYSMGISSGWGYPYGYGSGLGYGMGYGTGYGMNYGMGYGMGMGYGCAPYYNPYSCGYGVYDPWYGYGSFGYPMYGYYGSSYYSGYNAGYMNGYYNSLDPNSGYGFVNVGPRNSSASNTGGRAGDYQSQSGNYMRSVAEQQQRTERFTPVETRSQSHGRIQSMPVDGGGSRNATGGQQPGYQQYPQNPGGRSNSSGRIYEDGGDRGRQRSNENWQQPSQPMPSRERSFDRPSQPRQSSGSYGRPRG